MKLEEKKIQKERNLLGQAYELFTTKGFSKTTISDIVESAGVAKGTFYLYFKDKFDIRDRLIAYMSARLFRRAMDELEPVKETLSYEEQIFFTVDSILAQLEENPALLRLISKNLSWAVFKNALVRHSSASDEINFLEVYRRILANAPYEIINPETAIFMIVELISSTSYSVILYKDPCTLEELKPKLHGTIRFILRMHKGRDKEC